MKNITFDLQELFKFWDNEIDDIELSIKYENNKYFLIKNSEKDIFETENIFIEWLNDKVIFFPIIEYYFYFKWVTLLKKKEYIFLFLYIIDDYTIAIFSNNIWEYLKKNWNKECELKLQEEEKIENSDFEKLTSSFYLFTKEKDVYKWRNILSFFPVFLQIAFKNNDYKDLIYKIKWDSVAFFKSRYMQEKEIKTIISDKNEGKNIFNALFYANLLKNLTFKIENCYIDLNWKWKWGFNISTLKNTEKYFENISNVIQTIIKNSESFTNDVPVFFLDKNIWRNNNLELEKYNFIDIFPRVFKNNYKWDEYFLDFRSYLPEDSYIEKKDLNLKAFLYSEDLNYNFQNVKQKIKKIYYYKHLNQAETENIGEDDNNWKNIQDGDLFILFSNDKWELFLWKIKETCIKSKLIINWTDFVSKEITNCYEEKAKIKKWIESGKLKDYHSNDIHIEKTKSFQIKNMQCKCLEKWYYVESYKLHSVIAEFSLGEERIDILKDEKVESINFIYWQETSSKVFSFKEKERKEKIFLSQWKNTDWLDYFFNWADIKVEDMISLWIISQLNGWKILIWDKKAKHGELADIIWYKQEWSKSIIHLLHIKTSPFLTNWRQETYSYYTTAIWQMLQKIEPILSWNIKDFFPIDTDVKNIKEKITEYNWETSNIYNFKSKQGFLTKIKNSKSIELRIWVAILESQLDWEINNKTFYMINNILLSWFHHTIKPFLDKEISIIFYPIVIKK